MGWASRCRVIVTVWSEGVKVQITSTEAQIRRAKIWQSTSANIRVLCDVYANDLYPFLVIIFLIGMIFSVSIDSSPQFLSDRRMVLTQST